jgi:lipid-A-disaccharide synthase-like uncharacterized protein
MTGPESWQAIGFVGQGVFTARFLVQWIASEKKRDSVVPIAFWWLSLLGGFHLLAYAIYKRDPVFIVGQGAGLAVYVRNLMIVGRKKRRASRRVARAGVLEDPAHGPHPRTAPRIETAPDRSS